MNARRRTSRGWRRREKNLKATYVSLVTRTLLSEKLKTAFRFSIIEFPSACSLLPMSFPHLTQSSTSRNVSSNTPLGPILGPCLLVAVPSGIVQCFTVLSVIFKCLQGPLQNSNPLPTPHRGAGASEELILPPPLHLLMQCPFLNLV